MSDSEKDNQLSSISEAIRAKRERKGSMLRDDIAELEAALIADIENFDLDAAERRARREYLANSGAGMVDAELVFPEIVPQRQPASPQPDAPSRAIRRPRQRPCRRSPAAACSISCAARPKRGNAKCTATWPSARPPTKPSTRH
jgi:hypothetical protein